MQRSPPSLRHGVGLGAIPLARLTDEAWWVALWFGMNISMQEVMELAVLHEKQMHALEETYEAIITDLQHQIDNPFYILCKFCLIQKDRI